MDGPQFDGLMRSLFAAGSRRQALTAAVVGVGAALGVARAEAKKKKKKKKCQPLAQIKCGDTCCDALFEICGTCGGCCPEGQATCCVGAGNKKTACCESIENCCGSNCCHPGTKCCFSNSGATCIVETECCPPDCNGGTCCNGQCCPVGAKCCGDGGCCQQNDVCCQTTAGEHYCCAAGLACKKTGGHTCQLPA